MSSLSSDSISLLTVSAVGFADVAAAAAAAAGDEDGLNGQVQENFCNKGRDQDKAEAFVGAVAKDFGRVCDSIMDSLLDQGHRRAVNCGDDIKD